MQKGKHKRRFKLSIVEKKLKVADRELLAGNFARIKALNKIASKAPKDLQSIFTAEIKTLRQTSVYDYAYRFFAVTLSLGPHKQSELFSFYPETSDIISMKDSLLSKITKHKEEKRRINKVMKEFQGMRYELVAPKSTKKYADGTRDYLDTMAYVGNVEVNKLTVKEPTGYFVNFGGGATFTKPNSILDLMKGEEYRLRIRRAKKPYDKANYVGVELEIIANVDRQRLDELFIANHLAGNVYIKTDGSIRPEKPNDIAHEVTILAKDENIEAVIKKVCSVLNNKEVDAYVNTSCGMHVHVDMRRRDPNTAYNNFYKSLNVLSKMVPSDRTDTDHGRRYCSLVCGNTFKNAIAEGSRYKALNAVSYHTHKTLEIRLHSGTTNATKINNWVKILLAIANHGDILKKEMTIEDMRTLGLNDEIIDYIKARTKKFEDRSVDTRKDHFESVA